MQETDLQAEEPQTLFAWSSRLVEATGSHPDSFLHGRQSQGAEGDASKISLDQGEMEPVFRKVLLLLGPPAEQMGTKSRGRQQTPGSSVPQSLRTWP